MGGFRAGWSLGTIRRHGPGEVLAMGSCWDVPPTLGQSSPAPARSPAPPPPPLPRPPAPSPSPPLPGGAPLLVPRCFRPCVVRAGGWPLVGVLGCGPSSPLFLASPYVLTHVMLQFGPVSLCTCLLSLVFQLAMHLHAGFYLHFACLHSFVFFSFPFISKLVSAHS